RDRDQRLLCLLRGADEHLPTLGIPLSHQPDMVPTSAATQPTAPADVGPDASAHYPVPAVPVRAAPVAGSAVRRHILEVGAECVSSACSDLCGGWSAMTIPTAIKPIPGCRRCFERGRQHEQAHHRERPLDPAWSKNLACADALCAGTGTSRDRPFGNRRRSASGRRGAVADDARSREVRLCHSSLEADEQSGPDRSGAGGAKGGGQGEREPAKHAPDTETGARVTGAGTRTASSKAKE